MWAAWPSLVARGDRHSSGDADGDDDDDDHQARVEAAVMRTAFEEAFERQLLSLQVRARAHRCSISVLFSIPIFAVLIALVPVIRVVSLRF